MAVISCLRKGPPYSLMRWSSASFSACPSSGCRRSHKNGKANDIHPLLLEVADCLFGGVGIILENLSTRIAEFRTGKIDATKAGARGFGKAGVPRQHCCRGDRQYAAPGR